MTNRQEGDGDSAHQPCAVVAGHSEFAAGMISAVQRIGGVGNAFRGVSNDSLDADGLEAALLEAVGVMDARVIFTDLPAGSCTIAARRLARHVPGLTIVSGTNLPMLLDFAFGGGGGPAAAQGSAEKGREAIIVSLPADRA